MDGTQIQQGDVERGEKTTQLSRSESICTQHSAESHLRESKIGRFATSPAQSARIRAYHHLALAHSSADSDVTTQDVLLHLLVLFWVSS